jgi:hypothetical protein
MEILNLTFKSWSSSQHTIFKPKLKVEVICTLLVKIGDYLFPFPFGKRVFSSFSPFQLGIVNFLNEIQFQCIIIRDNHKNLLTIKLLIINCIFVSLNRCPAKNLKNWTRA